MRDGKGHIPQRKPTGTLWKFDTEIDIKSNPAGHTFSFILWHRAQGGGGVINVSTSPRRESYTAYRQTVIFVAAAKSSNDSYRKSFAYLWPQLLVNCLRFSVFLVPLCTPPLSQVPLSHCALARSNRSRSSAPGGTATPRSGYGVIYILYTVPPTFRFGRAPTAGATREKDLAWYGRNRTEQCTRYVRHHQCL